MYLAIATLRKQQALLIRKQNAVQLPKLVSEHMRDRLLQVVARLRAQQRLKHSVQSTAAMAN